jgi:hypothetical protein
MISGQLVLDGFNFGIADANQHKIVNGKPTDETRPVKVLSIDSRTGISVQLVFSPEDFQKFASIMQQNSSAIIPARGAFFPIKENGS